MLVEPVSGAGGATLSYAAVAVPKQIPIGRFPTAPIDVDAGGLSQSAAAPAFGQMAGVQFY